MTKQQEKCPVCRNAEDHEDGCPYPGSFAGQAAELRRKLEAIGEEILAALRRN